MFRKACVGFPAGSSWRVKISWPSYTRANIICQTRRRTPPPNLAGLSSRALIASHNGRADGIMIILDASRRTSIRLRNDGWPWRSNTRSNIWPAIVTRLISLSRRAKKTECNRAPEFRGDNPWRDLSIDEPARHNSHRDGRVYVRHPRNTRVHLNVTRYIITAGARSWLPVDLASPRGGFPRCQDIPDEDE